MHSNGKEKKKKTCTCYAARSISKMESWHVILFPTGSCGFQPACFEACLSKLSNLQIFMISRFILRNHGSFNKFMAKVVRT